MRTITEDLDGERVDAAPIELQLQLNHEDRTMSRESTLCEEKIAIAIGTERSSATTEVKEGKAAAKSIANTPRTIATPRKAVTPGKGTSPRKIAIPAKPVAPRNVATPAKTGPPRTAPRNISTPGRLTTPGNPTARSISRNASRNVSTPARLTTPKIPTTPNISRAASRNVSTPGQLTTPRNPTTPKTPHNPQRPVTRPSTQGKHPPRTPQTRVSQSSQSKRKFIGASVKALDKSKSSYVKYAKAVFKDSNAVYRKKIKLTGKVQKKRQEVSSAKSVKLSAVTRKQLESSPLEEKKDEITQEVKEPSSLEIDLVKEINRPENKIEVTKPIEVKPSEQVVEMEPPKEPAKESTMTEDSNFFVCANEEENPYAELIEMQRKEREEKSKKKTNDKFIYEKDIQWSTAVPQLRRKGKKDAKPLTQANKVEKLYKRIEEIGKFSMLRNQLKNPSKREENKSKRESAIENEVLTKIYFNGGKGNSKVKQRQKRDNRPSDLMRHFRRIPTLVNWVECSNVLSTPAMKMQSKLTNHDSAIAFDNVKNQKFKFEANRLEQDGTQSTDV